MTPFAHRSILFFIAVSFALPSFCFAENPEEDAAIAELEELVIQLNDEQELESKKSFLQRRFVRWAAGIVIVLGGIGGKWLLQAMAEASSDPNEETGMFSEVKIKTRCTHCKKGYRINVTKVGQSQKCGNCGKSFIVEDATN